jgi:ketosteroid isomerase-like protein
VEESLALQVVRAFVAKINAHKADALYDLMTEDHLFVDALGSAQQGRELARQGWIAHFNMTPDYYIACDKVLSEGETIAIFGRAGGTYSHNGQLRPANRWEAPAAWKVVVRGTRVAEWRIYTDSQPIHLIMLRIARQEAEGPAKAQ